MLPFQTAASQTSSAQDWVCSGMPVEKTETRSKCSPGPQVIPTFWISVLGLPASGKARPAYFPTRAEQRVRHCAWAFVRVSRQLREVGFRGCALGQETSLRAHTHTTQGPEISIAHSLMSSVGRLGLQHQDLRFQYWF